MTNKNFPEDNGEESKNGRNVVDYNGNARQNNHHDNHNGFDNIEDNDDDDNDDLFEDNIWNNISALNGDQIIFENGFVDDHNNFPFDNDIIHHSNENEDDQDNGYILLSQNENLPPSSSSIDGDRDHSIRNNHLQYYRHNYQVEWIETNEPILNNERSPTDNRSEPSNHTTGDSNVESNVNSENMANDDNDKLDVDTIRGLMENFQLPPDNYPEWARNISDDEWQQHLRSRITRNSDNRSNT